MSEEVRKGEDYSSSTPKDAEKKPLTEAQLKAMKRGAIAEALEYKRRLKESVELKELQVKELELNIRYFNAMEQYTQIEEILMERQAKEDAELQAEMQAEMDKKLKPDLQVVKTGKPRTAEEIEKAKE